MRPHAARSSLIALRRCAVACHLSRLRHALPPADLPGQPARESQRRPAPGRHGQAPGDDLLGTPSIADPFHHERWDYIATQRTGRVGTTEIKNLTLWFEGDALATWEGEYFPEQDEELAKEMRDRFGNLPNDKEKKQQRAGR